MWPSPTPRPSLVSLKHRVHARLRAQALVYEACQSRKGNPDTFIKTLAQKGKGKHRKVDFTGISDSVKLSFKGGKKKSKGEKSMNLTVLFTLMFSTLQ